MRIWSLHPQHLDGRGLVALWREGLLARAVLLGRTKGYRSHPQLARFRRRADPVAAIDSYLHQVAEEARARGYRFDVSKLGPAAPLARQPVRAGQMAHEWRHLLRKLQKRDRARWLRERRRKPTCHPSFRVVPGGLEPWERPAAGRSARAPRPSTDAALVSRRAPAADRMRP